MATAKKEYLKDNKNSAEMWNTLTQHVPDEVIGRKRNNSLENNARPKVERDHLQSLRKGINPKLNNDSQKLALPPINNTINTDINKLRIAADRLKNNR